MFYFQEIKIQVIIIIIMADAKSKIRFETMLYLSVDHLVGVRLLKNQFWWLFQDCIFCGIGNPMLFITNVFSIEKTLKRLF